MLLDGLAGLKFLLSGDASHFIAVVNAHKSFYLSFGKTLTKRNQMKRDIKEFATTAIYRKSIVMDYFLRGKRKFSQLNETLFN